MNLFRSGLQEGEKDPNRFNFSIDSISVEARYPLLIRTASFIPSGPPEELCHEIRPYFG